MSEEMDIVKSLELTAEGSWNDGYRKGIADAIKLYEECHGEWWPMFAKKAEKLLKGRDETNNYR